MKRAAFLAAAGLLLLRAFGRYQAWFTRPWRGDPGNHNYVVLAGDNLREAVRTQMQPLFEYWLRAKVWLPWLGTNERAFRLPGVFYGLLLVALGMAIARRYFSRKGEWVAMALALALGAWLSGSEWLAWEATGGRHYALVAFFSVAWFSLAFLDLGLPPLVLHLVSLLFVNSHFFALPLVGAYYLLGSPRKNWKPAALIFVTTLLLNWPALSQLLFEFPAETRMARPLTQSSALVIWLEGWKQFWVPALGLAWFGAVYGILRQGRMEKFWLFLFGVVPLEIAALHALSAYPFKERYHAVFLGQVFVVAILGCDGLLYLTARWKLLAPVALFVLFGTPGALREGAATRPKLVPANFSDTWVAYRKIASLGPGTLVLHEQPKADVRLARFYLAAQGICEPKLFGLPSAAERKRFEAAWGMQSTVVLDGVEKESCRDFPRARLLHKGERCVHVLISVTSFAEVEAAAEAAGFPLSEKAIGYKTAGTFR